MDRRLFDSVVEDDLSAFLSFRRQDEDPIKPAFSCSRDTVRPDMDRLFDSAMRGDVSTFLSLVRQDEDHIKSVVPGSRDTALHLAARFGHLELASEIVNLRSELVLSVNEKLETPLYEAAREGRVEILKLFLEVQPCIGFYVNRNGESVLSVACESGKLDVVKFLLGKFPLILRMESHHTSTTSLHAASSRGHTDVVKEIVKVMPEFARKKDSQGCTPLHLACMKGHLEIIRVLLRLDPYLTSLRDNDGRTPLHWAVMKGHENIVAEIGSMSHQSTEMKTDHAETLSVTGLEQGVIEDCMSSQLPNVVYIVALILIAGLLTRTTITASRTAPTGFNRTSERAMMVRENSFKVFMVCNFLAMFLFVGTVILLIGVIPLRGKSMMKLLASAGKVFWMALTCLTAAYIAAMWTILEGPGTIWVVCAIVVVGITIGIFKGQGSPLIQNRPRKWECGKSRRNNKDGRPQRSMNCHVEEMQTTKRSSRLP